MKLWHKKYVLTGITGFDGLFKNGIPKGSSLWHLTCWDAELFVVLDGCLDVDGRGDEKD